MVWAGMTRILFSTLVLFLILANTSCSILPWGTSQNVPLEQITEQRGFSSAKFQPVPDRCGIVSPRYRNQPLGPYSVSEESRKYWKNKFHPQARLIKKSDLYKGFFVGVALSGGGSRAANFSAAVLFELERLGLRRDMISAISSVSGGSVTAAYYGLYGDTPEKWNPDIVYPLLRTNFEAWAAGSWLFNPFNLLATIFTDYDRSDIMADLFDSWLYKGQTFRNLETGPIILMNASMLGSGGCSFVFTDEIFNNFGSDINSYPISHAVMASAAFPALFNSVTLTDHFAERTPDVPWDPYTHIYDGGVPSENSTLGF